LHIYKKPLKIERMATNERKAAITNEQEALSFTLPEIMTIETAEVLAGELKQLPLSGKMTLGLDASRVESITTPGIQLIVALEKALTAQGGTLKMSGKRESFNNALRDLGLERLIKEQ